MSDFTVNAILDMQRQLQERYKAVWAHMEPREGRNQILWMICELGEVIDIVKKKGEAQIMENTEVRRHFVEEMTDVLMYYGDVLLCYDITAEELQQAYEAKWRRNMQRWNPQTGEQEE